MPEQEATEPADVTATETQQPDLSEITAVLDELGITPGQLKGRLEASRKNEARAKENAEKAQKFDQLQAESQSETEKLLSRAEQAEQLVDALRLDALDGQFRAAFAGREFDVDAYLETVNPAKFFGDDGHVNREAISALAEKLAPPQSPPSTSYVQGKHTTLAPTAENALVSSVLGIVGARN